MPLERLSTEQLKMLAGTRSNLAKRDLIAMIEDRPLPSEMASPPPGITEEPVRPVPNPLLTEDGGCRQCAMPFLKQKHTCERAIERRTARQWDGPLLALERSGPYADPLLGDSSPDFDGSEDRAGEEPMSAREDGEDELIPPPPGLVMEAPPGLVFDDGELPVASDEDLTAGGIPPPPGVASISLLEGEGDSGSPGIGDTMIPDLAPPPPGLTQARQPLTAMQAALMGNPDEVAERQRYLHKPLPRLPRFRLYQFQRSCFLSF